MLVLVTRFFGMETITIPNRFHNRCAGNMDHSHSGNDSDYNLYIYFGF